MLHQLRVRRDTKGATQPSTPPELTAQGGYVLPTPTTLFVETTSECNLRCRHCHMWQTKEPTTALTTAEKLDLLGQFAAWSPGGTVVLAGGETTLKRDEFFALTGACRALGLIASANTNGTFCDDATLQRLLTEGPRYLVFSLDSHLPEVHDWIRGVPGTFDRVVAAVRTLLRDRSPSGPRVLTNTVLFDRNVGDVGNYVEFAKSLGVDGMTFQVLGRTFALRRESDPFFERHFPRNHDQFDRAAELLVALRRLGYPIETTESDIAWMRLYVRNPDFLGEPVCGSADRNVIVDQHGEVHLCFSMRDIFGGRSLGNVRDQSLRALCDSALAKEARTTMGACRRSCGMLNCHRQQADA